MFREISFPFPFDLQRLQFGQLLQLVFCPFPENVLYAFAHTYINVSTPIIYTVIICHIGDWDK